MRSIAALVLLVACFAGCEEARSATCKTDADCAVNDGGKAVCFDTRCVSCHYDSDCPVGSICNRVNYVCDVLEPQRKDPESSDNASKWEPTNFDDCAKACSDPACAKGCSDKFPKKGPAKK
jgi:hypothetical protein